MKSLASENPIEWHVKIIAQALNKVQQQHGYAQKDGTNSFHRYSYVSEEGLVKLLRESFVTHGLVLTPSASETVDAARGLGDKGHGIHIVWKQGFHLCHTSGAVWPFELSAMCEGTDNGDKSVWKGLTNAHKHVLLKLLMMPTGEDPEADNSTDQNFNKPKAQQAPAPAQATPRHTPEPGSPNSELNAWVAQVSGGHELSKDDFRRWGIYPAAFKAAEAVFGKEHSENKFICLDDFKKENGLGRNNPMCAHHVGPFLEYATRGWYRFQSNAAPQPGDASWPDAEPNQEF